MTNYKPAIYVSWEESERDWGTRPDGFSLHLTHEDYNEFVKEYWAKMPDAVPDEYSRPAGSPTNVSVSNSLYQKIKLSGNGIRGNDDSDLVKKLELVFDGKRSGWVPV